MSQSGCVVRSKPLRQGRSVQLSELEQQLQDSHPCFRAKHVFQLQSATPFFSKKCLRALVSFQKSRRDNGGDRAGSVTVFPRENKARKLQIGIGA